MDILTFIRDQAWQFWGVIVGLAIGLPGLVLASKQISRRGFSYRIESYTSIINPSFLGDENIPILSTKTKMSSPLICLCYAS